MNSMNVPGYEELKDVLERAYDQAARGKGHVRHAASKPFIKQPILELQRLYGVGFAFGQAAKKIEETQRLEHDAAIKEILGAINYLAAAVIYLEDKPAQPVEEITDEDYKNTPVEPLYLYRRKGLEHFSTCTKKVYDQLSVDNRFEVKALKTIGDSQS